MEIITSRDNPQVKLLTGLLTRKKERDLSGCFAVEGLRLCVDAVRSGVVLRTLLLTPETAAKHPETGQLEDAAERVIWLDGGLAQRIGDTQHPQGIYAICEKLDNCQSAVTIKSGGTYLLLSSIQDPGNLGAMLRTAQAMGIDGVFLSGDCPDLYSPKLLRGAMGGVFRLHIAEGGDLLPEIAALQAAGLPVYAAALTGQALRAGEVDFSAGGAVVIGNEGNGLASDVIDACTAGIFIPMTDTANSLGAATAAGILLWEMAKSKLA